MSQFDEKTDQADRGEFQLDEAADIAETHVARQRQAPPRAMTPPPRAMTPPPRPMTPPRGMPMAPPQLPIEGFAGDNEHTQVAETYGAMQALQAFERPATSPPIADAALQQKLDGLARLSIDQKSEPAPRGPSTSRVPWIVLAIVVAVGGAYHILTVRSLRNQIAEAKAQQPASGSGHVAEPTRSLGGLLASGYVAARAPIIIGTTTMGRLQEMKVTSGDTVTKGQVLAVLDDSAIRAELGLAQARLGTAQRAANRMRMLARAQAATPADLEHAVGQVEVAAAEVRVVQQKLEQMRIKSPINGTVLEVIAHPGESLVVGLGQTAGILKLADLTSLVAEVDVAEGELRNVWSGQHAEVVSDSMRGHKFHGIVREIAEQADRARGTVQVKVEIVAPAAAAAGSGAGSAGSAAGSASPAGDNTGEMLKPGMAVQVRFLSKEDQAPT